MFMVVNKDKIISYFISVSTVVILFVMPYVITKHNDEVIQTSSNTATVNKSVDKQYNNNTDGSVYNSTE